MLPTITLNQNTADDVRRLAEWLDDDEVSSLWYGHGDDGAPLHIGYTPRAMLEASESEWRNTFESDHHKIYAIYADNGDHIGEGQLVIERALQEAQLFILIGRKDLWHQHFGSTALIRLLDEAYQNLELHRVWVDVPEYNEHALQMFRHIGFVLEGHLRKTHKKNDEWYDSYAMGLLTDEYVRRRTRLMGETKN